MAVDPGQLRHRVAIQQKVVTGQDPDTGAQIYDWATVAGWEAVPAQIVPMSVNEYVAGQQIQSKVTGRIMMRYRAGLMASMRIVHKSTVYNIEGLLPDPDSGIEWITIPVSSGVNPG